MKIIEATKNKINFGDLYSFFFAIATKLDTVSIKVKLKKKKKILSMFIFCKICIKQQR